MNSRSARIPRAVLCSMLGASLISVVVAQTAPTPSRTSSSAEVLERYVVTGSKIPMAVDAAAVPVTILGRQDLEATGLDTNLLEVLQKRMPIFAGNGNLGATNSNVGVAGTYGGSNVSLRNLATLVLLNGRRLPENGANARGGRSFVDVNQIPLAAVQSIEVLTDGASAIYGSDAIGGVVNLKLRSDFNGVEVGGRYAFSTRKGDYEEKSGYIVAGAKRPGIGITVSGSWSEITPLYQNDRPFSTPIVGRTATISGAISQTSAVFPTAVLRSDLLSPSRAVPTGTAATAADLAALVAAGVYQTSSFQPIADSFDLSPLVTLTFKSKKKSGSLAATFDLIPETVQLFVEGLYSTSDSFSQLAAQPITSTVPANSPYNPTRSAIFAAFRYVPAPRQYINTGELQRIVGGLRGKILNRFNWEVGYNRNANKLGNLINGVLYGPNLQLGLAGGYDANGAPQVGGRFARVFPNFSAPPGPNTLAGYQAVVTNANTVVQPALDIFARPAGVDPASIRHIFGSAPSTFFANLKQIDGVVTGSVFDLPAGPLGAAVGYSFTKEELIAEPDVNSYATGPTAGRWTGAIFYDPFNKFRDITAAFAEVRVPITSERMNLPGLRLVELSAAYRYEDYSDAGTSKVPKFGLRWRPFDDDLTVRATYSEAFAAPALYSLFGPTTQAFTATAVIPNVFGINGQGQIRSGSNSNLKPSTADTYSIGLAYSPKWMKGLTVSVDYIGIDQVQLVGAAGSTEILRSVDQQGTASPYINQVSLNNWPSNPDPNLPAAVRITSAGQLGTYLRAGNSANQIFMTDSLINIAGQKVKALDVAVNYELPWKDFGRFNASATGTFFIDYQFQALPTQRYYEYAGHITNGGTGAQGAVPGMRWYSSLAWNKGPWSATLGNTHIDAVTDIGPGGITFASSTTLQRRPVSSSSLWDASVQYSFASSASDTGWRKWLGGARITLGVNNFTDRMPSISPQSYNESQADVSTYNPIGRLWYVSAKYKF
ncbi:MAG: TonB-dependent receptor [Verrucomicrobia bacterium]|nr:TonB-dependent receptor [Verrucomicrobiota bacterium]